MGYKGLKVVRQWQCPICDVVHDRDVNAAIHILNPSTVGATQSNAWGQPVPRTFLPIKNRSVRGVRPEFAAATGQRWTIQEANLL